ncbi:MAG: Omp28-related outer membrane protein [Bacteroidales bacterium]|nr:Omp28-related outer membrane protein [Bacteroidales bacterium]
MKHISKKISHLFFVVACAIAFCFSGCEKMENPYYTNDPEPNIPLFADSVKKVLLEDFTGIRCNNCPAAAKLAEGIADASRTRVIVMAVHAGHLAKPDPNPDSPYTLDLQCPEGDTYYKDFNITANPMGVINRFQKSAGDFQYSAPKWEDAIKDELQKPLTFKLTVEGSLADNGTAINAKITYTATETATAEHNLLVFLVEDGIVGSQLGKEGHIENYVFHNVLRETLHGDAYYGVSIGKPSAGEKNTYEFNNYKIKSINKKAETSTYKLIVAITQRGSKYIEQVEEIVLR